MQRQGIYIQTFLPYPSFEDSAYCLDDKRLGKQRVEAKQIYFALTEPNYGWQNHPAVKMWKGYEFSLLDYGLTICREWRRRDYNDSLYEQFLIAASHWPTTLNLPKWVTPEFCLSHQSNLLRKNPSHYRCFFPDVPNDLPYVWPVK